MGGGQELHGVQDLIRFPWENDEVQNELSSEEIEDIRQQLRQENEKKEGSGT